MKVKVKLKVKAILSKLLQEAFAIQGHPKVMCRGCGPAVRLCRGNTTTRSVLCHQNLG